MKRRITPEQLQELTDKQKQKLMEWWKPKEGDWYEIPIKTPIEERKEDHKADWQIKYKEIGSDHIPLLDISQMIELLEDSLEDNQHYCEIRWCRYEELCDILWKAVKAAL